mmetsp:Transcript_25237/g.56903  ORF Transcript_25237/g.56903 Transcript_25237/m.56903 type:complete len:100 (+) Transcript_25237:137-436(+)
MHVSRFIRSCCQLKGAIGKVTLINDEFIFVWRQSTRDVTGRLLTICANILGTAMGEMGMADRTGGVGIRERMRASPNLSSSSFIHCREENSCVRVSGSQ